MADRIPVKAIYSGTYGSSDVTSLGELSSGETINGSYITDNSVTLAKMAHGTDGELITYDATGAPANVAVGTSGQVLTSGGAGVAPTFQTAAGGGKVLQVVYANPSKSSQVVSAGVPSELTTDLRIAITPQSSTSKLYFDFAAPFISENTNALTYAYFYNVTATAVVNEPPASGSRRRGHWSMRTTAVDNNDNNMLNMSTVDSSSSTSARTYTIYHGSATASYDVQFYVSTLSTGDGSVTQPLFKITEVEV